MNSPILDARTLLASVPSDEILVSLSGGKDSLAVLQLCVERFSHVEAFFMYIVRGVKIAERDAIQAANRCGVKLHFVQHWENSRRFKYGVYCPMTPSSAGIKLQKIGDVENRIRAATGIDWVANGARANDGVQRRIVLERLGGVDNKNRKVYPIFRWRTADVLSYLKANRITIPRPPGTGVKATGFALKEDSILLLKNEYPEDYAKVEAVFPFIGALIERASQKPKV